MKSITFFVPGIPRPGGSKKAFRNKYTGKTMVTETGKYTKDWRATVATVAAAAIEEPFLSAVSVDYDFQFLRPKSHTYSDGRLRAKAPRHHISRPDATKLVRSTEDALKGIAWRDDSQCIYQKAEKRYSDRFGVEIRIIGII